MTRDEQWTTKAVAVAAYRAEHGRWPSARSADADERSLGAWLGNMRGAAKGGRGAAAMTAERIAVLDALAPKWTQAPGDEPAPAETSKRDDTWAQRLSEYRARVEAAQALSTSHRNSDDADEARLGLWLMTQRHNYRKGTLSAERVAALEEIPDHIWNKRAANFDKGLALLDAYVQEHGTLPSRAVIVDPIDTLQADGPALRRDTVFKLGHWLANQRRFHAAGTTTAERAAQLDAVAPGWNWVDGS